MFKELNVNFELSYHTRLYYIKKLVSFFFIIGIGFSLELWIPNRFFPHLPFIDHFPVLSNSFNYFLLISLCLLLVINALLELALVNLLIIIFLLILLLEDQNRWQPWVYTYLLILFPYSLLINSSRNKLDIFPYLQALIVGIYVWSGIHKLNSNFINDIFYFVLTKLFWFKEHKWLELLKPIGYCIPIIEIAIGICLFIKRFRNLGVYGAILTHLFILIYLSPIGINSNSVIYPWNIAMMILVILLFYNVKGKVNVINSLNQKVLNGFIVLLVWILPALNFFGYWDNYLSFSLYSGKINAYYIVVGEKDLSKIDKKLKKYFLQIKGLQGGEIIDVNKWAMEELNVPFYPETRTFKILAKTFCKLGINNDQLYFLEFELPLSKAKFLRFTCTDREFK